MLKLYFQVYGILLEIWWFIAQLIKDFFFTWLPKHIYPVEFSIFSLYIVFGMFTAYDGGGVVSLFFIFTGIGLLGSTIKNKVKQDYAKKLEEIIEAESYLCWCDFCKNIRNYR